ncbi:MAG: LytTR family DNA-binding domain-containing protein [Spirochaetia bacterium]|nr:LytTR family DNA-binding domain-containing protein [Spirochaetia bacterium]
MIRSNLIRVFVVEDEPAANELLCSLVQRRPELILSGSATTGTEALERLRLEQVDLVFMDIHLPDISGFHILEQLDPEPYVIFTTGSGDRALDDFEIGAIDYITKPVSKERFNRAVDRALPVFQSKAPVLSRRTGLFIAEKENYFLVKFADIIYVSSHENYSALHTTGRDYVTYCSLKKMEERLPAEEFLRIYKQYVVNLNRILRVQSDQNGNYTVFLDDADETELPVGRTYLPRLREILQ